MEDRRIGVLEQIKHCYANAYGNENFPKIFNLNNIESFFSKFIFKPYRPSNKPNITHFHKEWDDGMLGMNRHLREAQLEIITYCKNEERQIAAPEAHPFRRSTQHYSKGDPLILMYEEQIEWCMFYSRGGTRSEIEKFIEKNGELDKRVKYLQNLDQSLAIFQKYNKYAYPESAFSSILKSLEKMQNELTCVVNNSYILDDLRQLQDNTFIMMSKAINVLEFVFLNVENVGNLKGMVKALRNSLNPHSSVIHPYGVGQLLLFLFNSRNMRQLFPIDNLDQVTQPDLLLHQTILSTLKSFLESNQLSDDFSFMTLMKPEYVEYYNAVVEWLRKNPSLSGMPEKLLTNDDRIRSYFNIFALVEELAEFCVCLSSYIELAGKTGEILLFGRLYKCLQSYCKSMKTCTEELQVLGKDLFGELDKVALAEANDAKSRFTRMIRKNKWVDNFRLAKTNMKDLNAISGQCQVFLANISAKAEKGLTQEDLDHIKTTALTTVYKTKKLAMRRLSPEEYKKLELELPTDNIFNTKHNLLSTTEETSSMKHKTSLRTPLLGDSVGAEADDKHSYEMATLMPATQSKNADWEKGSFTVTSVLRSSLVRTKSKPVTKTHIIVIRGEHLQDSISVCYMRGNEYQEAEVTDLKSKSLFFPMKMGSIPHEVLYKVLSFCEKPIAILYKAGSLNTREDFTKVLDCINFLTMEYRPVFESKKQKTMTQAVLEMISGYLKQFLGEEILSPKISEKSRTAYLQLFSSRMIQFNKLLLVISDLLFFRGKQELPLLHALNEILLRYPTKGMRHDFFNAANYRMSRICKHYRTSEGMAELENNMQEFIADLKQEFTQLQLQIMASNQKIEKLETVVQRLDSRDQDTQSEVGRIQDRLSQLEESQTGALMRLFTRKRSTKKQDRRHERSDASFSDSEVVSLNQ